jgi:PncC family amidohydrolase
MTLATMETCTGGHVASAITDDPRYPAYFRAGLVAPTTAALADFGVPAAYVEEKGIASMAVAEAMAAAVRTRMGVSIGIGVTGFMPGVEPGGKIAPGTINVALNDGETRTTTTVFPRMAADVKRWAMLNSLDLVRRRLLGVV